MRQLLLKECSSPMGLVCNSADDIYVYRDHWSNNSDVRIHTRYEPDSYCQRPHSYMFGEVRPKSSKVLWRGVEPWQELEKLPAGAGLWSVGGLALIEPRPQHGSTLVVPKDRLRVPNVCATGITTLSGVPHLSVSSRYSLPSPIMVRKKEKGGHDTYFCDRLPCGTGHWRDRSDADAYEVFVTFSDPQHPATCKHGLDGKLYFVSRLPPPVVPFPQQLMHLCRVRLGIDGEDQRVYWDWSRVPTEPHTWFKDIDVSPCGQFMAAAVLKKDREETTVDEVQEHTLRIYDITNWEKFHLVAEYAWPASLVSFSRDGMTLAMIGPECKKRLSRHNLLTVVDVDW